MNAKRAAIYARVSGDDRGQDGRNLAGQLAMGSEYAEGKGYQVVAELAEDDRGASGASFELEQLNRALEMAQNGRYDVLIVREIDRLSRNLAKQLIVEEELKRAGVSIEYVLGEYPDTPEGNLMKHIRATVAEYEREKIRERITRGKRLKVKSGSVMTNGENRPPYGYRVIELDKKWALEIDESEAQIVRMIFDWYAYERLTIREIARKLTGLCIPTRMDKGTQKGGYKKRGYGEWADGQVAKIINGEVYRGRWQWGKRGKSGEELITVAVPAIVDNETWQMAQERRATNKAEAKRNRKNSYLLTGRLKCGCCQSTVIGTQVTMRKSRYYYYRCQATRRNKIAGVTCHSPMFRVDKVDYLVWEWVKNLLGDMQALKIGLETHKTERERQVAPLRNRLSVVEKLIVDQNKQLSKLIDLYLSGDFDKDMLTEKRCRLENTIVGLERERASLIAILNEQTLTPEQIQNIYDFALRISRGLEQAESNPDIQRNLIASLELKAKLVIENGEKVVYAECVLGENSFGLSSVSKCNGKGRTPAPWLPPRSQTTG